MMCNIRNSKLRIDNKSGVKGVHWNKQNNAWKASIQVNGKMKYICINKDFDETVLARLAVEQCLNWAGCESTSSAYIYAINHNLIKEATQ